ncbi:hypothetical protein [Aliarcobacter butzleri]|uniref:hypothetical protein n=1 Tax=Aliarcobacter butzleri TaxID=28197 RepID=UPI003AF9E3FC
MNILSVHTGNEKLDEAYERMQIQMCSYDKVDEIKNYMNCSTRDTKEDEHLKWPLRV